MTFLKELVSDYLVVFASQLAGGKIPDDKTYEAGVEIGKVVTDKCRVTLGKNWNRLEDVLQDKIRQFMTGFHDGLDSDD